MQYRTCYDNGQYNRPIYGRKANTYEGGNLYYGVCPAGIEIRRQIGKRFIYRVQSGNGYYGSKQGKKYQHKYNYFVPSSINNPEGTNARTRFATAVSIWQSFTEGQKEAWRARERYIKYMSGYNIFIKWYMTTPYIALFGVPYFGAVSYGVKT